jgi:hypothetical protein
MDPLSIVFGILGVFGTGVSCYNAVSSAASSNKDAKNLYWKLRIEESRFVLWGRSWGVSSGSSGDSPALEEALRRKPELGDVLKGILEHVVDTLGGAEKLRSRAVKATEGAVPNPTLGQGVGHVRVGAKLGLCFSTYLSLDPQAPNISTH